MANFKKKDFTGEKVTLDGNNYDECNFRNAKLVYGGGPPPNLIRCNFTGSSLDFDGAAANTISLLKALSGDPTLIWVLYNLMPNLKPKA